MGAERTLLIERTAKRWKGIQLAGVALILLGFLLVIGAIAVQSPVLIYAAAAVPAVVVCVTIYAMVMAWWHHG